MVTDTLLQEKAVADSIPGGAVVYGLLQSGYGQEAITYLYIRFFKTVFLEQKG